MRRRRGWRKRRWGRRRAKRSSTALVVIPRINRGMPVVGIRTVGTMIRAGVTAIAIEARKTLMMDRVELLRDADAAGITIMAVE